MRRSILDDDQRRMLRALHCVRCYDAYRRSTKVEPCRCDCHREPDHG